MYGKLFNFFEEYGIVLHIALALLKVQQVNSYVSLKILLWVEILLQLVYLNYSPISMCVDSSFQYELRLWEYKRLTPNMAYKYTIPRD